MDIDHKEFKELSEQVRKLSENIEKFSELYNELVKGNHALNRPGKLLDMEQRIFNLEKGKEDSVELTQTDIEFIKDIRNILKTWKIVLGLSVLLTAVVYSTIQIIKWLM